MHLNAAQLDVIQQASGSCLVLGGAGTGKSTALILKVAYLLQEGRVPPPEILVLTPAGIDPERIRDQIQAVVGNGTTELIKIKSVADWMDEHERPKLPRPLPYQVILVDDYQRIQPAEADRIRALRTPQTDLVVFGDPNLTLDGDPTNDFNPFTHFKLTYRDAAIFYFSESFRCPPPIIKARHSLITHATAFFDRGTVSRKANQQPIELHVTQSISTLKADLKKILRDLVAQKEVTLGDVMILTRTQALATQLGKQFAGSQKSGLTIKPIEMSDQQTRAIVMVVGLDEGVWPAEGQPEDDERRRLYRAMGRCEAQLLLWHIREGEYANPSKFLQELPERLLNVIRHDQVEQQEPKETVRKKKEKKTAKKENRDKKAAPTESHVLENQMSLF